MKIAKKLLASGLSLLMLLCVIFPASAASSFTSNEGLPTPEHYVGSPSWSLDDTSNVVEYEIKSPSIETYAPNLVEITAKATRYGIVVHVSNLGVDTLDSVTVTAQISGYKTTSLTASVPPIIGKDFTWNAPMIKVEMDYYISAVIHDGTQNIPTRTGHWELNCTEESLVDIWHAGTWPSRQDSLQYHFDKHHRDYGLNIYNIPEYIETAVETKWDTYDNPDNYYIIQQAPTAQYVAAHKYTNKNDGRFILIADDTDEILSFGGA